MRVQEPPIRQPPYTRSVSSDGAKLACRRFALWWLGGFSFAGAIGASLIFAVLLGGGTILAFLAIAILGTIIGLLVGLSVAQCLALISCPFSSDRWAGRDFAAEIGCSSQR